MSYFLFCKIYISGFFLLWESLIFFHQQVFTGQGFKWAQMISSINQVCWMWSSRMKSEIFESFRSRLWRTLFLATQKKPNSRLTITLFSALDLTSLYITLITLISSRHLSTYSTDEIEHEKRIFDERSTAV